MRRLLLLRNFFLLFLVAGCLLGLPLQALAGTTATVTVTYSGYICGAPGGFTVEYVNDYEVILSWTMAGDAVQTMVRAAVGHVPSGTTDGYQVYLGANETVTDNALSLASPDITYYRLWSQNASGVWEIEGTIGSTEDLMSASFLFLGLILLGAFLTWFSSRVRNLLLAFAAGVTWWGLGFWLFFSTTPIMNFNETYSTLLAWVFFMLGFVPFVLQMNVESRRETKDKYGNVWSWSEFSSDRPEAPKAPSTYDSYRKELQKRVRKSYRR